MVDPAHCGGCANPCAQGEVCLAGICSLVCGSGSTECNGQCVDISLDPANCGECGHACEDGFVCSGGTCAPTCSDSVRCGDACVDPLTNVQHCGACNKACGANQICVNGACKLDCAPAGLVQCGYYCVDISSNAQHCGGCQSPCPQGRACVEGECACPGGLEECLGACTETQTDPLNCGVCGVGCRDDQVCDAGVCQCAPDKTQCGSTCVDVTVSSGNCGACEAPCLPGNVCTDGICEPAVGDWCTFQHDVQHSGATPDASGNPPLRLAWSRALGSGLGPPALRNGRLFITKWGYFDGSMPLMAFNASDGEELWSYNFGSTFSVGQPAAFEDSVYVGTCNHTPGTYLWSFDAETGSVEWVAPMSAQWETYWSPIRVGSAIYTNGGYYGGLYGFNAADGGQLFFNSAIEQYDEWSPAYFNGAVFTFVEGNLRQHSPDTGAVVNTTSVNWDWSGWSMSNAPVFDSQFAFVIHPPNLSAINPSTASVAWTANGSFAGTPAVADGVVYAISAGNLIARDAATGAFSWTFVGDTQFSYPPVIAEGYAYVASTQNVYAVDLGTHQQVWTAPVGGWLAVGARRLFVAGADGTLTAFVLSPSSG